MYIHKYIYTHIYIYIYICIYIYTCIYQQITVSPFGEHKRLHLESSKQNYYITSLRAMIKAIFTTYIYSYMYIYTFT